MAGSHATENDPHVLVLDESIRGDVVAVGGFGCRLADLAVLSREWRSLKTNIFQINADHELKYNFPGRCSARTDLEANGHTQVSRVPEMLTAIADLPLLIYVSVMHDSRDEKSPADYVSDGVTWCTRRFANQVGVRGSTAGHLVIVDEPGGFQDVTDRKVTTRLKEKLERGRQASFDAYRKQYEEPQAYPDNPYKGRPLKELGFSPHLLYGDSETSDALQIADLIVGAITDWAKYELDLLRDSAKDHERYTVTNMRLLVDSFRTYNGRPDFVPRSLNKQYEKELRTRLDDLYDDVVASSIVGF